MSQPQNVENHARFVPAFHFFVAPVFLLNVVWSIVRVVRNFSVGTIMALLVAIALFLLAFTARIFALTVQDRVIRLEMRLRMQQLLPADLRGRIPEYTVEQLVALRFASDVELPALARKVLDEKLANRKTIKRMVQDWQADLLRA
jgi:HAMP domain-containing protein